MGGGGQWGRVTRVRNPETYVRPSRRHQLHRRVCPLSLSLLPPPPSIPQLVLSHWRLLGEKRRKAQRVKMEKRDMGESERER